MSFVFLSHQEPWPRDWTTFQAVWINSCPLCVCLVCALLACFCNSMQSSSIFPSGILKNNASFCKPLQTTAGLDSAYSHKSCYTFCLAKGPCQCQLSSNFPIDQARVYKFLHWRIHWRRGLGKICSERVSEVKEGGDDVTFRYLYCQCLV